MRQQKHNVRYFRIFMCCYIFLAAVMIICGLAGFYRFIEDYENNLPYHVMDEMIESSKQDGGASVFYENLKLNISRFENPEKIAEALFSDGEAAELHYKRSSIDYKDAAPVYVLCWGKKDLAKIFLSEKGKSDYGFPVWEIERTEPILSISPEHSIEAVLPAGAVLYINGVAVPNENKTNESILLEGLDEAANYVTLPTLNKYKADGLYLKPEVTAENADGVPLNAEIKGNSYRFFFPKSTELEAELGSYVLAAENAYINYMVNENHAKQENYSRLSPYLIPNSQIDKALRKVDVEWNIEYDSRVNEYIKAENFIPYGEDCFTCELVFKVVLKKYRVESDFSGHFRWTFVRTETGWKAVQMELI